MKKNAFYLLIGLLFSSLTLAVSVLLLSFLMMKTDWSDSGMKLLLFLFFFLSVFFGGRYFAKHAEKRRFLWGICFGACFFLVYAVVTYIFSADRALLSDNAATYLMTSLAAGCTGGMFS